MPPRLLLACASFALLAPVAAQPGRAELPVRKPVARNAVYAEIGGNGVVGSVNVERRVTSALALRVGATYWGPEGQETNDDAQINGGFAAPILVMLISGGGRVQFDGGFGAVASTGGDVVPTVAFGLRLQPPGPGPMARVGLVGFAFRDFVIPFAGASLGYGF